MAEGRRRGSGSVFTRLLRCALRAQRCRCQHRAAAASTGGGEAREDDAYASGLGRMSWSSRVLPPCATTSTNSVPWLAHAAVAWFMEVASSA